LIHYIKFYTCRTDEDSKLVVETFAKIHIYGLITWTWIIWFLTHQRPQRLTWHSSDHLIYSWSQVHLLFLRKK